MSPDKGLPGVIDTHIHTFPDPKPRLLSDVAAAQAAKESGMGAIVIKSHLESTAGRARIATDVTDFPVYGGVTLNSSVGGLNRDAVEACALHGGRVVWMPTLDHQSMIWDEDKLGEILGLIRDYELVLATGHLNSGQIFDLLDLARSYRVKRILVNHPLTRVVGASLEEQKEMSRWAYMEHCYVACMPLHDGLDPALIAQAIKEVGASKCIMATDFGQAHNPAPVVGMKLFGGQMLDLGIKMRDLQKMTIHNPAELL